MFKHTFPKSRKICTMMIWWHHSPWKRTSIAISNMYKHLHVSSDSLSNIKNRDYGSQKYEQWIVDVQKKCRTLQLEDKQKESQLCRELFNYTEHLRVSIVQSHCAYLIYNYVVFSFTLRHIPYCLLPTHHLWSKWQPLWLPVHDYRVFCVFLCTVYVNVFYPLYKCFCHKSPHRQAFYHTVYKKLMWVKKKQLYFQALARTHYYS